MNRFNSEASILFVDDRRLPRANKNRSHRYLEATFKATQRQELHASDGSGTTVYNPDQRHWKYIRNGTEIATNNTWKTCSRVATTLQP
jgi:hypothetical protein